MILSNEEKAEITFLLNSGDMNEALRSLMKLSMTNVDYHTEDKIFINYNLAWSYNKLNNKNMANIYLNSLSVIFDDVEIKEEYELQYHQWLWLYSDVNENDILDETYIFNFMKIYKYYRGLDSEWFSNGAMWNIVKKQGKKQMIKFLVDISMRLGAENKLVESLIAESKSICNEIYIEVLDIIDSSKKEIIYI